MSVEPEPKQETIQETMAAVLAEQQAEAPAQLPPETEAEHPSEASDAVAQADDREDAPVADAAEPEPEVAEPAGGADASEPTALDPLQHWSNQDKERFAALDDAAKEFVLDRAKTLEKSQLQKHREMDSQARQYQAVVGALDPFKDQMTRMGVSPEQAVAQIAARWSQLQSTPAEALAELARQYGPSLGGENGRKVAQAFLNAAGLSADALADEDISDLDPTEAKLTAEFDRRFQAFEAKLDQLGGGVRQSQEAQVEQQITAFRTAKDTEGKLLRPHYDDVQTEMAGLLQGNMAQGLDDAYQKALLLRPDLQPRAPKPNGRAKVSSTVPKSSPAPGTPAKELAGSASKSHTQALADVARDLGL